MIKFRSQKHLYISAIKALSIISFASLLVVLTYSVSREPLLNKIECSLPHTAVVNRSATLKAYKEACSNKIESAKKWFLPRKKRASK